MRFKTFLVTTLLPVLLVCMYAKAYAQDGDTRPLSDLPRQFSATAFGQAGSMAGKSFGLTVYITGWTTDDQVKDDISVLKEKGPDGLVSAMDKTEDVGRIAPVGFVGNGFRFARYRPTADGGLHIVMVTNRRMSFGELYRNGRSTDYQFGIVVLDVDKNGKGTGKLAPVCKIQFNKKNELVIENYGQKPFRLANVYLQK
ncbi:hypothetical protein [Tunturiibacter lichenicola]|uniref:hypothetical protein n=1 Tax=Tunturiibacter lichenicola TaxID=2051959 RepID=UPI0021B288B4|nr:hypothetical protein [Edaphobacter lichenicola]